VDDSGTRILYYKREAPMRAFRLRSLVLTAAVVASATGCTCATDREGPRARPPHEAHGGEARPAVPYPVEEPAPPREAFALVTGGEAPTALAGASRAGSWAGLRRGGEERRSAGNFLCRLEALYGRAPIVLPDRVAWVLRDEERGLVLTAVADASGPWIGVSRTALADPTAQTTAANVAIELARLLDATEPTTCRYTIAGTEIGVRDGEWY
jgi:hypothetical protein